MQKGNLDVPAVQGNATPMLQLQKAVVRAGQADGDRAGADRIRVLGTLPGGACEGRHHHCQPSPNPFTRKNPNQAASASLTRNHSLLKTPGPACPCCPKGNRGPGSSRSPPGALSVLPFAGWSRRKKYTWGLLGPHPCGHPRAAWWAHLDSLYDNGEGVVLAVLGQQVLADPTEGEVPVVKALEVGLSCDKTLSWGDGGEEREGVPVGPLGGVPAGGTSWVSPHHGLERSPTGGLYSGPTLWPWEVKAQWVSPEPQGVKSHPESHTPRGWAAGGGDPGW